MSEVLTKFSCLDILTLAHVSLAEAAMLLFTTISESDKLSQFLSACQPLRPHSIVSQTWGQMAEAHLPTQAKHKWKLNNKKVSEYDQEIPQSHTADQPMAP